MDKLKSIVITKIDDIFTVYSSKGRFLEINNRGCYGFSFCTEGQITYTHNGIKYVSDNKHIIILPEGQTYTLTGDKTGVFAVIDFKCTEKLADTFILLPTEKCEEFMYDFKTVNGLFMFPENHTKVLSIFYDMIHRLISENSLCKTIAPAIKYIEENYRRKILTNEMLADVCNISEVYLRKLFKKHLNTTPKQYISDIRLQKAKYLLKEGALKVNVVAEECGFDSSYNFCRFFKNKTGTTPSEYMKNNKTYKI